jgi:hypothetical protein
MARLTREQILSADDLKQVEVVVPEWGSGATVLVCTMTGTERDAYEASIIDTSGEDAQVNRVNARAKLLVQTIIGDDGARLFREEDIAALGGKSGAALDRVYEIALRLNKITEKDAEELGKNSRAGRSAGCGSDLQSS